MSVFKVKIKNGYKWRALIRIKGYPQVSKNCNREKEALDWERETRQKIKDGCYDFAQNLQKKLFSELVDRYIKDYVKQHHKSSKDTIRHLEYFKKRLGKYALVHVNTERLFEERETLLKTPTYRGTPRDTGTVNRYFQSLGGLFNYAKRTLRWVKDSPTENFPKLKETPKKRRTLEVDEIPRLLHACRENQNSYLYCITLLGLTTGARKGEILSLTWDCIDFEKKIAHIKDSKNGYPRRIPLVPSVVQELQQLFLNQNPNKPLVFASKTAFGKIDIKRAWNNALNKAGIENFVFHGLRHHFASYGGQIGATGMQLRSQLGHSTSSMTDHYCHLDAESTRFIGESIEKQLFEVI